LPINTVFELAAMAADDDPALRAADRLLLMPDLFHLWLCGSRTTELTNATTTQCYDPIAGRWAEDVLDRLEIPAGIFPDVVAPGRRGCSATSPGSGSSTNAAAPGRTRDRSSRSSSSSSSHDRQRRSGR